MDRPLKKAAKKLYRPPPGYGFKALKAKPKASRNAGSVDMTLQTKSSDETPIVDTPQRKSLLLTIPEVDASTSSTMTMDDGVQEDRMISEESSTNSLPLNKGMLIEPKPIIYAHENEAPDEYLDSNTKTAEELIIAPHSPDKLKGNKLREFRDEKSNDEDWLEEFTHSSTQIDDKKSRRITNENTQYAVDIRQNKAADCVDKLKCKQNIMEDVLRKLLVSLKELKNNDIDEEIDFNSRKERRMKVARMMQVLLLQRKNLQIQTHYLSNSLQALNIKYTALRKQSECCIIENMKLNRTVRLLRAGMQEKDEQIKHLNKIISYSKEKLLVQSASELSSQNTLSELDRLKHENQNLKEAYQDLDRKFEKKSKDCEAFSHQNSQIEQELNQNRIEISKLRLKCNEIAIEDVDFQNRNEIFEAGIRNKSFQKSQIDQLREDFDNLQYKYQRLEKICLSEMQARKSLHFQLQNACARDNIYPGRNRGFQSPMNETRNIILPSKMDFQRQGIQLVGEIPLGGLFRGSNASRTELRALAITDNGEKLPKYFGNNEK